MTLEAGFDNAISVESCHQGRFLNVALRFLNVMYSLLFDNIENKLFSKVTPVVTERNPNGSLPH